MPLTVAAVPVGGSNIRDLNGSSKISNSRPATEVEMLSRIAESMFWIGRYVERPRTRRDCCRPT